MSIFRPDASAPETQEKSHTEQHQRNFQAAMARTLSRSIALYFSRPVRLFRPAKVSGWHSINALAAQHGKPLSVQYIISLVKNQGFVVIPKHFIPPMLVNMALGTVLWTTYAETSLLLEPYCGKHPTLASALAGGVAGGMQALVAAPAENARLILEGGPRGNPTSNAWKEVFRGTNSAFVSKQVEIEDVRQVRRWMKDVGEMAGRGWGGWGWGVGKDICGFSIFFSIFEVTRRLALEAKATTLLYLGGEIGDLDRSSIEHSLPRITHCVTLISGGVMAGIAYEVASRPWDIARRTVELDRLTRSPRSSVWASVLDKIQQEGLLSLFRLPTHPHEEANHSVSPAKKRFHRLIRTVGRVGPWGVGFLVWEIYGGTVEV